MVKDKELQTWKKNPIHADTIKADESCWWCLVTLIDQGKEDILSVRSLFPLGGVAKIIVFQSFCSSD